MLKTAFRLISAALLSCACIGGAAMAQDASESEVTKGGALNMIVQPEPPMLVVGLNTQGPTLYVAGRFIKVC